MGFHYSIKGGAMMQDILVGAMAVIAIAVGIFGWWLENGTHGKDPAKDTAETQESETRGEV
jgi:hypothetical protein